MHISTQALTEAVQKAELSLLYLFLFKWGPQSRAFPLFTATVWLSLCDFLCGRAPQIPFLSWPEAVLLSASHTFKPSLLHCLSAGNPIFPLFRSLSSCLNCLPSIFIPSSFPFPSDQAALPLCKGQLPSSCRVMDKCRSYSASHAALPTPSQGGAKWSGFRTPGWLRRAPVSTLLTDQMSGRKSKCRRDRGD